MGGTGMAAALEGGAVSIAIPAATGKKIDEWLKQGCAVTIRPDEIVVTPPAPGGTDLDLIDYRRKK